MKWLVVVIFAGITPEGDKDLYVFTNPTFDTQLQCQADITDPAVVPILVNKVIQDNGYRKIEKVVCLLDNDLIDIMKTYQEKKKGVEL